MKPTPVFCLAVSFCAWAIGGVNNLSAQDENVNPQSPYTEVAHELATYIQREIERKNVPAFSIALVDGDAIVWANGFGFADPENQIKATAKTTYRVGSVSKLLNDMAVVQFVEQGKLNLDSDIREVLPQFAPRTSFGTPITLRQLMNHTSGLVREPPRGNYFDPTQPSLSETVESLNETALLHEPGSKTKYSNAAVSVAGYALEKVTGKPFADHLQEALLEPLGMHSSSFLTNERTAQHLAKAQMWSFDGRRFEAPNFSLGTIPAGNLYSNVVDLSKFMIAIFNDGKIEGRQVIAEEWLDAMLKPQTGEDGQRRSYGIGFRMGEIDGHATFEHGGAVYGYATQFRGLKDKKIGVIAVASLDVANGFVSRVTNHALRLMLAAKQGKAIEPIPSTGPVEKTFARSVAGLYENDGKRRRLYESDGRLMIHGDTYDHEVRRLENHFIIDDVLSFGPNIEFSKDAFSLNGQTWKRVDDTLPPECPPHWRGLVGEYGWDHNTLFIYEKHGQLWTLIEWVFHYPLTEVSKDVYAFPNYGLYHDEHLLFSRDENDNAVNVVAAEVKFDRRASGPAHGETFKIQPLLSAERLRQLAMVAEPPVEQREMISPDLIQPSDIESSIKLDVRYASTNNFMGTTFYKQPRAFLQRPAAEALVTAHRELNDQGYGLLIYDAYRPWFVTKMFWDATPPKMKHFVADPEKGSRHNRGCAVDLTLYNLESGEVVPMVAGYDEFSERAYPNYPGGTSQQRWHRRLLRQAMERSGFEIYEYEWWHFDYSQWRNYGILNQTFEQIENR